MGRTTHYCYAHSHCSKKCCQQCKGFGAVGIPALFKLRGYAMAPKYLSCPTATSGCLKWRGLPRASGYFCFPISWWKGMNSNESQAPQLLSILCCHFFLSISWAAAFPLLVAPQPLPVAHQSCISEAARRLQSLWTTLPLLLDTHQLIGNGGGATLGLTTMGALSPWRGNCHSRGLGLAPTSAWHCCQGGPPLYWSQDDDILAPMH